MITDRLDCIAKSTIAEYPHSCNFGPLGEEHIIKSDTTEENGGVEEEETLVRSFHSEAKTADVVVEHIKQEHEDEKDETTRSRLEVKFEMEDDPLARKRRQCFYLNQLQTTDDLYREKKVFCVGVNWTFEKEELLQIAEV